MTGVIAQVRYFPFGRLGAAEEVTGEEGYVGGALSQAAHEVGEPVAAVGNVDAQAIAVFDEAALQIGAHTVEHLEFKIIFGDLFGSGEANGRGDHGRIVCGDSVIEAAAQKHLHQGNEIGVHVFLFGNGHFGGFLVGAFAKADAAAVGEQIGDVCLAAI